MAFERASKLIRFRPVARAWKSSTRVWRPRPRTTDSWRTGRWPWPCKANSSWPWNCRRLCGHIQLAIDGSYHGLCDCLVNKGNPSWRFAPSAGSSPKTRNRLKVLAWAYAESKDFVRAKRSCRTPPPGGGPRGRNKPPKANGPGHPRTRLLGRASPAARPGGRQRQDWRLPAWCENRGAVGRREASESAPAMVPMLLLLRRGGLAQGGVRAGGAMVKKEFPDDKGFAINLPHGHPRRRRGWAAPQPAECVPASQRIPASWRTPRRKPMPSGTTEIRRELADALAVPASTRRPPRLSSPDAFELWLVRRVVSSGPSTETHFVVHMETPRRRRNAAPERSEADSVRPTR